MDLWLTHMTMAGWVDEIVEAKRLEARRCNFLNEDLIYFFALKPAYALKNGGVKADQASRFPAMLIFDPSKLPSPHHVYPFDTGAALSSANLYGDVPDPTVFLEDYELDPKLTAAESHIAWAFESRHKYFEGELRSDLRQSLPSHDKVGISFAGIANLESSVRDRSDGRCCTIEVAYRQNIPLSEHCLAVILPSGHVQDDVHGTCSDTLTKIRALGIDEIYYDWQPNESPENYLNDIRHLVREFLASKGVIDV